MYVSKRHTRQIVWRSARLLPAASSEAESRRGHPKKSSSMWEIRKIRTASAASQKILDVCGERAWPPFGRPQAPTFLQLIFLQCFSHTFQRQVIP